MTTPLPALQAKDGDVLIKVRAAPGSSRERVCGLHGDSLKVAVSAPPERGKANQAILRVLADALGWKRSLLQLESGATSRDKWVRIEGVSTELVRERLAALL